MQLYRRLDRAWARGEAVLTVGLLIAMVLIASFSAGIRNLTRFDVVWANALLSEMEWVDSFLSQATVLLAFLGASQAAYYHKHIRIDVIIRSLPLRPRHLVQAAASAAAGVIVLALAVSLGSAVKLNLSERPVAYELLGEHGAIHVCDASREQLRELQGMERPSVFCALRGVLKRAGLDAEAPGPALQLFVPLLFIVIGCRFLGHALRSARAVLHGPAAMRELDAEEAERLAAVHEALRAEAPWR